MRCQDFCALVDPIFYTLWLLNYKGIIQKANNTLSINGTMYIFGNEACIWSLSFWHPSDSCLSLSIQRVLFPFPMNTWQLCFPPLFGVITPLVCRLNFRTEFYLYYSYTLSFSDYLIYFDISVLQSHYNLNFKSYVSIILLA